MDNRDEVSKFLTTRRARITPQQAGLPVYGSGTRRVPGLRREEVALVAGVSVDYYTRIERGDLSGVSDIVLDAIARALQFDDAERAHLYDLAEAASGATRRRSPRRQHEVRPALQHMLDGMTDVPAFVRNGRLDVLAANRLARALYAPVFAAAPDDGPVNLARFCMLDPQARTFYPDWGGAADTTVALLRTEAGRAPHDKRLSDLVGELTTRSEPFATRWAAHEVRLHHTGVKVFRHPEVGELRLAFEAMDLPSHPGLTLTVYGAAPDSPARDALTLLATWAATTDHTPDAEAATDASQT
jgi:transcriptional regulator with XRE-family HTH domain